MGCETELFLDDDDDDDDDVKFGKCDFWNDFWKCDVTFDFKSFENMVPIWDLTFTLKMNFDAEIFFVFYFWETFQFVNLTLMMQLSICTFDFHNGRCEELWW